MWARITELLIAAWLVVTPFVFDDASFAISWIAAAIIAGLAILSWRHKPRQAHLGSLAVALALYVAGRFDHESFVAVSLFLLIFAIVPTDANLPPPAWRYRRG